MDEKLNKATEILDEEMKKVSGGDDVVVVEYYLDENGNYVPLDPDQVWEQIGENVTPTHRVDEQDKKNA